MVLAGCRVQNVPAIELPAGKKVERRREQSHPGCAAHWMQKQIAGGDAGPQNCLDQAKRQRLSENNRGMRVRKREPLFE